MNINDIYCFKVLFSFVHLLFLESGLNLTVITSKTSTIGSTSSVGTTIPTSTDTTTSVGIQSRNNDTAYTFGLSTTGSSSTITSTVGTTGTVGTTLTGSADKTSFIGVQTSDSNTPSTVGLATASSTGRVTSTVGTTGTVGTATGSVIIRTDETTSIAETNITSTNVTNNNFETISEDDDDKYDIAQTGIFMFNFLKIFSACLL